MNFFQELKNRAALESPKFFKKVQAVGVWLLAVGLALVGLPAGFEAVVPTANIDLSILLKVSSYMVLAGMIIKIIAGLPVINPDYPTLDKKQDENIK